MSYCRWSSDNWKCDVYCYEDCSGGWTTHVASQKHVDVPEANFPEENTKEAKDKWAKEMKEQMKHLETCTMRPIGLAYDGETFNDPTLEEFKERLTMLKEAGYNVPAYVFETIDDEINDNNLERRY